ncbi:MAG: sulfotransferase [Planctomycetota bacterium]
MTRQSQFGTPGGSGAHALLGQAAALQRGGDLVAAEQRIRAAIKLDRGLAEAHHMLAGVHLAMKRPRDALDDIQRALKIDERHPAFHATRGSVLFTLQDWARAKQSYLRAAQLEPRNAHLWFNVGLATERGGDREGAAEAYRKSMEIDPRNVRAIHALAMHEFDAGRFAAARELVESALAVAPGLAELWNTAGNVARAESDFERAASCFRKVTELAPRHYAGHMNLGQTLREAGHVDESVAAYRAALAVQPDQPHAHVVLAQTVKFEQHDAEVEWLEKAVADPKAYAIEEDELVFALAKAYTDLGEDDKAFDLLLRGNALKRAKIDWTLDVARERFARVMRYHDAATVARLRGASRCTATPIFVLGMPRSGTSLVEQILASHPQVHGAGELTAVDDVCALHPELRGDDGGDPSRIDAELLTRAAEEYLARTVPLAEGRPYVVDKLPANFLNLGAITAMFPRARIVHCIRDARDTCYSIFRQNFAGIQAFAYDLDELGRYYLLYEELMAHWRRVMPAGTFLDLVHEQLLDDFEPQVRRLLDHVGLPFDERCLRFFETERIVRTASIVQVRQPLFRTSLGQWRRHEAKLAPLLAALGPR